MNYVSVDVIKKEIENLKDAIDKDPEDELSFMFGQYLLQKILKSQISIDSEE